VHPFSLTLDQRLPVSTLYSLLMLLLLLLLLLLSADHTSTIRAGVHSST
jgi:hypothetical protein